MSTDSNKKILWGIEELMSYLRCGKKSFYQLVTIGLPVKQVVGDQWCGHADNLDNFMRYITGQDSPLQKRARSEILPPQAENNVSCGSIHGQS